MNFLSTFFPQTVYKTSSKHSGTIEVIDHVFERRLVVGGLTQSGGITKRMWEKVFDQQAVREKNEVNSILVLGVGAGTLVEVINKKWPDAKIVGVEIDPVIIDTGKKYCSNIFTGDISNETPDAVKKHQEMKVKIYYDFLYFF
jgi:spermidine synthase